MSSQRGYPQYAPQNYQPQAYPKQQQQQHGSFPPQQLGRGGYMGPPVGGAGGGPPGVGGVANQVQHMNLGPPGMIQCATCKRLPGGGHYTS